MHNLKLNNGRYRDFAALFVDYDSLPPNKKSLDVRENIKAAMIASGLNELKPYQERERMYGPDSIWLGVIKYVEEIKK